MSKYYRKGKKLTAKDFKTQKNDENNMYLEGYAVHRRGDTFYLTFPSPGHIPKKIKLEISKSAYLHAREGKLSFSEIYDEFKKFPISDHEYHPTDPI